MNSPENLSLWRKVQITDPDRTKPYTGKGGFKGTAINATYLAMRATETFGPMGIGWGVNVLDEKVLDGSGSDKLHRVHVKLWYKWDGERGEIEHFGQTLLSGSNRNGAFTDEDAPKKSLTDGMSKCLSLLGFGADVHLGMFDDNKYVAELRKQFKDAQTSGATSGTTSEGGESVPSAPPSERPNKSTAERKRDDEWGKFMRGLNACVTTDTVDAYWATYKAGPASGWRAGWIEAAEDQVEEQKKFIMTGELSGSNPNSIPEDEDFETRIKRKIDEAKSIDAVTDIMLHPETKKGLEELLQPYRDKIRDYAKARLTALGFPSKAPNKAA